VVALGRKNFLFAGSDGGGESASAIYSLLGTTKLNGIDRIEELLPWNCAASLKLPIRQAA
jgi:hypothetical protein